MTKRQRGQRRREWWGVDSPDAFIFPYRVLLWYPQYNGRDAITGYRSYLICGTFTLAWARKMLEKESREIPGEFDLTIIDTNGRNVLLYINVPLDSQTRALMDSEIPF